ncbi:hypothetical protein ACNKHT_28645 [Shigella flexneri]
MASTTLRGCIWPGCRVYCKQAYNPDLKGTGLMAAIPFLLGLPGCWSTVTSLTGWSKGKWLQLKAVHRHYLAGMFCSAAFTLVVPQATTSITAVLLIGMALFLPLCRNLLLRA